MFAFLLIICTPVHSGVQCLPPQEYKTLETCRRVGANYFTAAESASGSGRVTNVRCVQVKK